MAEPGETVLRVICRVDGKRTTADGQFIVKYDPRLVRDPRYGDLAFTLITSADITKAIGFASAVEALLYRQQVCPNVPTQADGSPNRPLTAFTCEVRRVLDGNVPLRPAVALS